MAPVAGRIADRKKNRLIFLCCAGKCLISPGVPVDRIVRVLEKVRTFLMNQPVGQSFLWAGGLKVRVRFVPGEHNVSLVQVHIILSEVPETGSGGRSKRRALFY